MELLSLNLILNWETSYSLQLDINIYFDCAWSRRHHGRRALSFPNDKNNNNTQKP